MTRGPLPTSTHRSAPPVRTGRRRRAQPLDAPAPGRLLHSDIAAVIGALTTVVLGLWVRHGGFPGLRGGWLPASTSLTQLTGLLASTVGLSGVYLIARPKSLERAFGLDHLFVWHRYLGETMALLLGVHVAAGIVEWAQGSAGYWQSIKDATGRQPYMAGATVGALLIGVVTISSLRSIRQRFAYETWYFIHLSAYFALAISFGHQIVAGGDFADDTVARWFWIALHLSIIAALIARRFAPSFSAALRPLRVVETTRLSDDTVSVRLAGPRIHAQQAEAGQFFMLRALRRDLWWQTHPFSLAAAPTTDGLEFSIKARGDASKAMTLLPRNTAVAVEGPYGICTPEVATGRKLLFIAGGIGIAPIRALMQRLEPGTEPIVLYRARHAEDLVHLDELRELAHRNGGEVFTLVGPSATMAEKDPFGAQALRKVVPDVGERVAVLCGPQRLLFAARRGLLDAGVSLLDIHFERPWW